MLKKNKKFIILIILNILFIIYYLPSLTNSFRYDTNYENDNNISFNVFYDNYINKSLSENNIDKLIDLSNRDVISLNYYIDFLKLEDRDGQEKLLENVYVIIDNKDLEKNTLYLMDDFQMAQSDYSLKDKNIKLKKYDNELDDIHDYDFLKGKNYNILSLDLKTIDNIVNGGINYFNLAENTYLKIDDEEYVMKLQDIFKTIDIKLLPEKIFTNNRYYIQRNIILIYFIITLIFYFIMEIDFIKKLKQSKQNI